MRKFVLAYSQMSDRILVDNLKEKPFNISIIVVSALTVQTKEEIDWFLIANQRMSRFKAIRGKLSSSRET